MFEKYSIEWYLIQELKNNYLKKGIQAYEYNHKKLVEKLKDKIIDYVSFTLLDNLNYDYKQIISSVK